MTVIVTGGSRGIGAAAARRIARDGHAVVVNFTRAADEAAEVVAAIRAYGGVAAAVGADVSEEPEVMRLFEAAQELGPLTALVNNAGIIQPHMRLDKMDAARFARVIAVNVIGTLLCSREAVRRMSTAHGGAGGAIVNLSSVAARLGAPGEYVDYAASKGAVDSFTVGLAREVAAEGIRVNAVRPGLIATDIHASGGDPGRPERLRASVPMQRVGSPEEVAEAITWLISGAASYVTGTILEVTGGR